MALEPRSTKLTHISLRSAVQVASHGMFVTRVDSVGIVDLDGAGAHVLCAVPGGVYETLDGAASWSLVNGSARFGSCNTITRGHIGGRPHMLLSCSVGVVNVEIVGDGTAASSEVAASCLAETAPMPEAVAFPTRLQAVAFSRQRPPEAAARC